MKQQKPIIKTSKSSKKMFRVEYILPAAMRPKGVAKSRVKFVEGVESRTLCLYVTEGSPDSIGDIGNIIFSIVGEDGTNRFEIDWERLVECEVVDNIPEHLRIAKDE